MMREKAVPSDLGPRQPLYRQPKRTCRVCSKTLPPECYFKHEHCDRVYRYSGDEYGYSLPLPSLKGGN